MHQDSMRKAFLVKWSVSISDPSSSCDDGCSPEGTRGGTARVEAPHSAAQDHIMRAPREDPAEQSGYLRFFYRDWRPTRLGKIWSRAFALISGLGLTPQVLLTLQVKSRSTGRLNSTILVVASHEGQRYLVSMLGDGSEWVRNVRAASGEAFIKRGRPRPVMLTEIPPEERAPILKAWCGVATSGRQHLPVSHDAPLSAFEAIRCYGNHIKCHYIAGFHGSAPLYFNKY